MQLNAVTDDREHDRRHSTAQFDFSSDRQCRQKFDCLAHDCVEVELCQLEGRLSQQAARPANDLAGAPVILQNIVDDIAEFIEVGARRRQYRPCRLGIDENSPKWLIDFVCN